MMTCRELTEVLLLLVSGELTRDHQDRCQEHLRTCPDCTTYKQTYELTMVVARKLTCALPAHCEQRLRTKLEMELGKNLGEIV